MSKLKKTDLIFRGARELQAPFHIVDNNGTYYYCNGLGI